MNYTNQVGKLSEGLEELNKLPFDEKGEFYLDGKCIECIESIVSINDNKYSGDFLLFIEEGYISRKGIINIKIGNLKILNNIFQVIDVYNNYFGKIKLENKEYRGKNCSNEYICKNFDLKILNFCIDTGKFNINFDDGVVKIKDSLVKDLEIYNLITKIKECIKNLFI